MPRFTDADSSGWEFTPAELSRTRAIVERLKAIRGERAALDAEEAALQAEAMGIAIDQIGRMPDASVYEFPVRSRPETRREAGGDLVADHERRWMPRRRRCRRRRWASRSIRSGGCRMRACTSSRCGPWRRSWRWRRGSRPAPCRAGWIAPTRW
ncbi:hypothetical protein ASD19_03525 [Microbacterium sp. Root53]|nr:hypothetical protein ASD19_03525 [Microbacterium sp. Root53]